MREELARSIWPLSQLGSKPVRQADQEKSGEGEGRGLVLAYPTDHTPSWNCLRQWCFQRPFCFSWHQSIPSASSNVFFLPFKVHALGFTVSVYYPVKVLESVLLRAAPCLVLRVRVTLRMTRTVSVESDSEAVNRYTRQCKLWNHINRSLECHGLSQNMHSYHWESTCGSHTNSVLPEC